LNLYFRIILILIAIAYLISPVDIIPDFMVPFLGFLDDGLVMAVIYYLIRYGTLPAFLLKKKNPEQSIPKSPYDILGIRPGATKDEITAAYKKAVKKYHPDKLSHLGEEFSSLANEKFLEIQRAYDALMKS
jgi:DnaJ-domain-containing protein 1